MGGLSLGDNPIEIVTTTYTGGNAVGYKFYNGLLICTGRLYYDISVDDLTNQLGGFMGASVGRMNYPVVFADTPMLTITALSLDNTGYVIATTGQVNDIKRDTGNIFIVRANSVSVKGMVNYNAVGRWKL